MAEENPMNPTIACEIAEDQAFAAVEKLTRMSTGNVLHGFGNRVKAALKAEGFEQDAQGYVSGGNYQMTSHTAWRDLATGLGVVLEVGMTVSHTQALLGTTSVWLSASIAKNLGTSVREPLVREFIAVAPALPLDAALFAALFEGDPSTLDARLAAKLEAHIESHYALHTDEMREDIARKFAKRVSFSVCP